MQNTIELLKADLSTTDQVDATKGAIELFSNIEKVKEVLNLELLFDDKTEMHVAMLNGDFEELNIFWADLNDDDRNAWICNLARSSFYNYEVFKKFGHI